MQNDKICMLTPLFRCLGGWIITGGTFAGVMKHVGKGIRDYTVYTKKLEERIVCLGIAAWGVVIHKEKLAHSNVCLNNTTINYVAYF